jgi:hypothetical protein
MEQIEKSCWLLSNTPFTTGLAAKDAEAASPSKRPNWVYAKNVLQIMQSQSIGF